LRLGDDISLEVTPSSRQPVVTHGIIHANEHVTYGH
jgi:hypothetical protein